MPPVKKLSPEQRYRLAINLFDLDKLPTELQARLLGGKLEKTTVPVDLDRTQTSIAVPFKCDLVTAALAIDIIRSECRRSKEAPIRAYINRGGEAWSRLAERDVLSVKGESGWILNEEIFVDKSPVEIAPPIPLLPEKIMIGKGGT